MSEYKHIHIHEDSVRTKPTGISNFWDPRKEEEEGEEEHEDRNSEVDPLDVLDGALIAKVEENVGTEDGGDNTADTIEGLRNVDADLRIPWWAANYGIECQS